MKTVMIAAIAGFAGLAAANPFLHQVGDRAPNMQAPRGTALTTVINLVNAEARDGFGNPINQVFTFNLGAGAQVIGLGWNVNIETIGASWLSEARVEFTNNNLSSLVGVGVRPGAGSDAPGNASFNSGGILDLIGINLDFVVDADGILRVELWDTFDDNPGAADAILNGSLTVQYIPTPGALAVLGLGGLVATRRRR